MIRIFTSANDCGNIFLKSKTNTNEEKKENFRTKMVQKAWFSQ